jgi:sterol desaturase/sphingolipid hydroxylase (fatty acid hydroxylase superfamily)
VAGAIFTSWAAVNHSNLRFGPRWLEWLVVTPRLHRTHHVADTSDRNLGSVFTFWDRLRGTLETNDAADPDALGVPAEMASHPQGWWPQLVHPPRAILARRRPASPEVTAALGACGVLSTIDHSSRAG